ncbi:hypothetical protein FN846DRAFT_1011548 [Sphaerosporella brunnea]|uniref:Ubiquitin carboxyl-terminal hydrolase n=1 Tax=Sphaerosporella brunnea TaxID=1250544 RepID=A0A5J5FA77_9PEZI|nr:hypothetical protein FN846DRAFT_1011548 [Sphaerosporella brunnea]
MPPQSSASAAKGVTLAYAATASLAAVTLVYVFGPTWFIDTSAEGSSKHRKKGVVGLANPANDCFINSILQALAGLEDLRTYLSQRTSAARQCGGLGGDDEIMIDRKPFLMAALKDILDKLNERPISGRKTISNRPFLNALERVFRKRISRAQQDAHEFLQVVVETLAEEHHRLRKLEREDNSPRVLSQQAIEEVLEEAGEEEATVVIEPPRLEDEEKPSVEQRQQESEFDGIPLEGRLVSEIECQTCQFTPKPTVSTFVVLTLPVPQKSSTSLSECIEGTLSTEYIDGFKCAKCTLLHAITTFQLRHASARPEKRQELEDWISRLQQAIEMDPEKPPNDIDLPEKDAPRSRIAKRTRIQDYPDIIALHLSRSIYDTYSRKNGAKVSFEEMLQMGGILDRKRYRLLCMVTHKGGHDSGHYECFRRQIVARPPFALPTPVPSSPATPLPSTPLNASTVRLSESSQATDASTPFSENSRLSVNVPTRSPSWLTNSDAATKDTPRSSIALQHASAEFSRSPTPTPSELEKQAKAAKKLKKKRANDRWWRISDDKIKEARTSDVLGMQKEVYVLFYQRERDEDPI